MVRTEQNSEQYARQRQNLIEQIRRSSKERDAPVSENVLNTLAQVPRERFVPRADRSAAYEDRALPIGLGQTVSQPTMVVWMTSLLELTGGEKVLEVGTGSGYQAYVLSLMLQRGRLATVERHTRHGRHAARRLRTLGAANTLVVIGDGSLGLRSLAPFDRILVTAGAPEVPMALVDQLDIGGRLVCPIGPRDSQELVSIERRPDGLLTERHHGKCAFVPLIGEWGWGI